MAPKGKGIGIMIAVGKPKGGPPPLDTPGKRPMPTPEHEATETPQHEASEEYGARLLGDLTRPLTDAGLGEDEAKSMLADIFDAAARCLRGDGETMGQQYRDGHGEELGGEEYR